MKARNSGRQDTLPLFPLDETEPLVLNLFCSCLMEHLSPPTSSHRMKKMELGCRESIQKTLRVVV